MNELLIRELEDLEKERFGFDINELSKSDWNEISSYEVSEEFIKKYHDKLDWDYLIDSGSLTESLIREFSFKYSCEDPPPSKFSALVTFSSGIESKF